MSERKKPIWPWIVAVVVMLPVLYVLSFGPACWISSQKNSGVAAVDLVYQPLMSVWWRRSQPDYEHDLLYKYLAWKSAGYWYIMLDTDGIYRWTDRSGYL